MTASRRPPTIPDYVAAWAAALHSGGAGAWSKVAAYVEGAGLGSFDFRELARAALAWERQHVAPEARRRLSAWIGQRRKVPPARGGRKRSKGLDRR